MICGGDEHYALPEEIKVQGHYGFATYPPYGMNPEVNERGQEIADTHCISRREMIY